MSKKNNSNFLVHNIVLYSTIVAALGIGTAVVAHYNARKKARREIARLNIEIYKNNTARHTYVATAPEFSEGRKLKHTSDSLNARNNELFLNAQEKYFTRIDKKYSLGRFFTQKQITDLNNIIMPYAKRMPKADVEWYSFIKNNTPIDANTTIPVFEQITLGLGISADKFVPMGMILDCGNLYMFNDVRKQKMLDSYLDEIRAVFSDSDENKPNFAISENAAIRDEYMHNEREIKLLKNKITDNGFIIGQTLARFGYVNDSLNALVEKNRQKLR